MYRKCTEKCTTGRGGERRELCTLLEYAMFDNCFHETLPNVEKAFGEVGFVCGGW
jgi:hypothetical protein